MRHVFVVLMLLSTTSVAGAADLYHLTKEIPIGGDGGWDYITVDPAAHRLYVSHATKVVVVDSESGKLVGEIRDTAGVHGMALAPDLARGFTSNGAANTSTIVDLKTLRPLGTVQTGGNPDAILYEPIRNEVYTMNGSGKSITVFGAQSGDVVATIDLGAKPEAAAEDRPTKRLFVNLEDTAEIAVIDIEKHTVAARWPLAGCEEPTGLGYDPKSRRLFSACGNAVMVVTDSVSGEIVTTSPIGVGADGAAFDPGTGYVLASNGRDGTVTVAHVDSPSKLTIVQTLATQVSARTMILNPVTHDIYLPAAMTVPNPSGRGRPQIVPDTFKVLVYGLN